MEREGVKIKLFTLESKVNYAGAAAVESPNATANAGGAVG